MYTLLSANATMNLKDEYTLANCCKPATSDNIVGYYSYDGILKVHKSSCDNLKKAEQDRLVDLAWNDIIAGAEFKPDADYNNLDEIDWTIIKHHKTYGVDYSLKIASMLHLDKQTVFDSHTKLRDLKILERVKELMMRYRKGIVHNKWIKHRNHTYYKLTDKGDQYLEYYLNSNK